MVSTRAVSSPAGRMEVPIDEYIPVDVVREVPRPVKVERYVDDPILVPIEEDEKYTRDADFLVPYDQPLVEPAFLRPWEGKFLRRL